MRIPFGKVEQFVASPDPSIGAILVYGTDFGTVRQRTKALITALVGSDTDPFRIAEHRCASLLQSPALLQAELDTYAPEQLKRVVWVRDADDNLAPLIQEILRLPSDNAVVLVDAGDLEERSALRRLFERERGAAALACYGIPADSIHAFVRQSLARHAISAPEETVDLLATVLSRTDLPVATQMEKFILFASNYSHEIAPGDVLSLLGDKAEVAIGEIGPAITAGDGDRFDRLLAYALQSGSTGTAILRAASNHFQKLHSRRQTASSYQRARLAHAPPTRSGKKGSGGRPVKLSGEGLSFCLNWTVMHEVQCKSTSSLDQLIAAHALLELAKKPE